MTVPLTTIPASWHDTALGEVLTDIVGGGTPSKENKEYFNGDIPLMTVKDMRTRRPNATGFNITEEALAASSAKLIPADTLIISTRMGLGKVVRASFDTAINQDLKALFPVACLDKSFLEYWLISKADYLASEGTGTTVKGIRLELIRSLPFPLPPFPEQQRIVERIDRLFAELETGDEALHKMQNLLTRYRQSLLKSAVTGQLTADWRVECGGQLEHGREVVAKVQRGRRHQPNAQPENSVSSIVDNASQPELPNGWVWGKLGNLFDVYGGATPSRREPTNWAGGIPWVSSGEVAFCRIRDTKEKITELGFRSCSTKLHPVGTVLLAMIGEGKTRGQAAILDVPACNNQNAAAIRVSETVIPPEFVYYYLLSTYDANRLKGQGGNQPALNGNKVKNFDLPICSVDEMNQIVRLIEERFSNIEAMDDWCRTELERSASLRKAILKRAFAGKLVPQDPTDEPAAMALERIRAETSSSKVSRRRTRS